MYIFWYTCFLSRRQRNGYMTSKRWGSELYQKSDKLLDLLNTRMHKKSEIGCCKPSDRKHSSQDIIWLPMGRERVKVVRAQSIKLYPLFSSQHSIPQPVLGFQHFHFLLDCYSNVLWKRCHKCNHHTWPVKRQIVFGCIHSLLCLATTNCDCELFLPSDHHKLQCAFSVVSNLCRAQWKKSTNVTLPQVAAFLVLTFMVETNCVQKLPDINVSSSCSTRSLIN